MTVNITVPELGESVLDATVSAWLKQEGDFVNMGDVLVELETDKVNVEVGAKVSGVLQKIQAPKGSDVKVGDVLGLLDEKQSQTKTPQPVAEAEPLKEAAQGTPAERAPARQVSPVAARLAREKNVDLDKVAGSGGDGRVTRADVESYLRAAEKQDAAKLESDAAAPGRADSSASRSEARVKMTRRRRTIAQRLLEARQSAAMLTTFNEIDMSAAMDLRKRRNEEFQKRHGVKLGFMSLFTRAAISALKLFPALNAELDGDEIVYKNYYDIGIAIGSEEGLVVPVIRDADKLSFADIEKRIKDFSEKTRLGKLSVEDLRGGTFTITNGGVFGSLLSTPILNLPQVGILGLHKIEDRPIALNGQAAIKPMMYVALSYDHRIVDGRESVQFLVHIKQLMEDPAWMLVEG
ncbi:MAG: 2-oxoglutarate dehydrogenase complex dihydrolipoyllysine-residue succinyltransferase [Anaerolineales bacterium]|jgi:2-oxoglutarate dehydrogenase E2 component (dihydrolipoamide succinyltransferase)|nr:Dihydrolipoyllysine-residue succinyltransferase component of 2-oxoglutarate dehydrogenase complex [Anaerolineales bacterium]MCC7511765.1 2-oxoglutarate dehydrogenase complex dihydrolipoyllysine-residue succinyltransferase [Anaerolineae bacterium]MDL1925066.1 2-oxoglutarate dehydrogenase complex dihydrolipoyllysine-residue succinyltransferase [Anaerolineae bacterium AMX1]OQY81713.1 MAG: dihydrolipoamide succinyltransferase [Anaerolineae bacterium UTCFX3]GER78536.1 dihydrolipoamide succinyltra